MSPLTFLLTFLPWRWEPTVRRCIALSVFVVLTGALGFMVIEGWPLWDSFYFTLVTLSTVGYDNHGLSRAGERFSAILLIVGIGAVSYAASQFIQYTTACALQPEKLMMKHANTMSEHTIVCGLGRTGHRVISRLRSAGRSVVAIDPDAASVEHAIELGITALCGDATDDEMLHKAGIDRADSIAAATSSDATNALICLSAAALKPGVLIIARAEDGAAVRKLERAGACVVINPSEYGGDGIAQSIVRMTEGVKGAEAGGLRCVERLLHRGDDVCGRRVGEIRDEDRTCVLVAVRTHGGELEFGLDDERVLNEGETLIVAEANLSRAA